MLSSLDRSKQMAISRRMIIGLTFPLCPLLSLFPLLNPLSASVVGALAAGPRPPLPAGAPTPSAVRGD